MPAKVVFHWHSTKRAHGMGDRRWHKKRRTTAAGSATSCEGCYAHDGGCRGIEGCLRGVTPLACIRAPSCSTTMYSSTSIMASRSVSVPRQCRSSASEYVSACGEAVSRPSLGLTRVNTFFAVHLPPAAARHALYLHEKFNFW